MGTELEPTKMVEVVLREVFNYEDKEVIKEERIIFLRECKVEKLKSDPGLLGDLLRKTSLKNP